VPLLRCLSGLSFRCHLAFGFFNDKFPFAPASDFHGVHAPGTRLRFRCAAGWTDSGRLGGSGRQGKARRKGRLKTLELCKPPRRAQETYVLSIIHDVTKPTMQVAMFRQPCMFLFCRHFQLHFLLFWILALLPVACAACVLFYRSPLCLTAPHSGVRALKINKHPSYVKPHDIPRDIDKIRMVPTRFSVLDFPRLPIERQRPPEKISCSPEKGRRPLSK
jgi:hypothetical protein